MAGLAIKVPVDDQALAATSAQAKIIRQEINALQVQIQKTAALGIPVAKEAEKRLQSLRQQYTAVTKARDEIKANNTSSENPLSVRDLHALKELAHGNISPHMAHHIAERLAQRFQASSIGGTLQGVSSLLGAALPGLSLMQAAREIRHENAVEEIRHTKDVAETFLASRQGAERIGLDENLTRIIETTAKEKALRKSKQDLDAGKFKDDWMTTYATQANRREEEYDKLTRENEMKIQEQLVEGRKLFTDKQIGKRPEYRTSAAQTQAANEFRDFQIIKFLETPEGQKALMDAHNKEREKHKEEIQNQIRREADPNFRFWEKERDEQKAVAYSLRSKRIPANPVDF